MLTIGVDVGGTSIKSALIEVDECGRYEILQFNSIPTEASSGRDTVSYTPPSPRDGLLSRMPSSA